MSLEDLVPPLKSGIATPQQQQEAAEAVERLLARLDEARRVLKAMERRQHIIRKTQQHPGNC